MDEDKSARVNSVPAETRRNAGRVMLQITRNRVTTRIPPPGTLASVRPLTYEISFSGEADSTLRAQFDDCKVTTGSDSTTLRAELPDQAALSGLVQRIAGLGLEVIHIVRVTPPFA